MKAIERLDEVTRRLRRECPWDREQDALDRPPHRRGGVRARGRRQPRRPRGDGGRARRCALPGAVPLPAARGEGGGDLAAVAEACAAKLIRRHPHVYGKRDLESAGEVLAQWEEIKREVEGGGDREPLEGLPENLPGLLYARKVLRRLDPGGSSGEEKPGGPASDPETREQTERMVGELLLEAVAVSRKLGVDPELALRATARRLAEEEG